MSQPKITVKDRGSEALIKRVNAARGVKLQVGVYGDKAAATEGKSTTGQISEYHEFGGDGDRPPERSWLRAYVDENTDRIDQMLRRVADASIKKPGSLTANMDLLGLKLVGEIKQRITDGIPPELKEATKKRKQAQGGKAKDTPLILTGQFIGSIDSRVTTA